MGSLNSVSMVGRVGRMGDSPLVVLPSGTPLLSFSVALSSYRKDAAGNLTEKTAWVDVSYFGNAAQSVSPFVRQGTLVAVHGRLEMDEWNDRVTGARRTKLGVVADAVQLLAQPRSAEGSPAQTAQAPAQTAQAPAQTAQTPAQTAQAPAQYAQAPSQMWGATFNGGEPFSEDVPF